MTVTRFLRSSELNGFDFNTLKGKLYDYTTCGAGCSEVEVDCLTGECQVFVMQKIMSDVLYERGQICTVQKKGQVSSLQGGQICLFQKLLKFGLTFKENKVLFTGRVGCSNVLCLIHVWL